MLGLGIVKFNKNITIDQTVQLGIKIVEELRKRNIKINPDQLLITPECGGGGVGDIEDAKAGFNNLPIVALRLQEHFGLTN